jgi:hypothetical protein
MRARHAQAARGPAGDVQQTERLGLLTPDHVGRAGEAFAADTRHDRGVQLRDRQKAPRQRRAIGGQRRIRRLAPALAAADHAAHQHVCTGGGRPPVADEAREGAGEITALHLHDPERLLAQLHDLAGRVEAQRARVGGPPIEADQRRHLSIGSMRASASERRCSLEA